MRSLLDAMADEKSGVVVEVAGCCRRRGHPAVIDVVGDVHNFVGDMMM